MPKAAFQGHGRDRDPSAGRLKIRQVLGVEKILDKVRYPEDLKGLTDEETKELCREIRRFLVDKVSKTGGHLSANLGVVELSVALHQVFDAPKDKILFDVGHQSYVHKLLTGRKEAFDTLRQKGGLSGFPKSEESPYDAFNTGHASTSISAAYGLAKARDLRGEDHQVVCVIGDGSLTGGLAYEAMNNAGKDHTPLIIILNDNEMSINRNVGALAEHLNRLRTKKEYLQSKRLFRQKFADTPGLRPIYRAADSVKNKLKYLLLEGILFEELGFTYLGPVDGHDVPRLRRVLSQAKNAAKPVLVHVTTVKGRGYQRAEEHPEKYHGVAPFDPKKSLEEKPKESTWAGVFAQTVLSLMKRDDSIALITAAMSTGTGIDHLREVRSRIFDVGIAEEHAVTFASGLAKGGIKPCVAIYSSFLQRAYDQILHDVCLQKLPVVFAVDHAGIVGEDGETHQGIFDIAYLSHIPDLSLMAPSSGKALTAMLSAAFTYGKPCAIRYPKGCLPPNEADLPFPALAYGKMALIRETKGNEAKRCAILSVGDRLSPALWAQEAMEREGYGAAVVDARFIKPLDQAFLKELFERFPFVITVEEHVYTGGFGMQVEGYYVQLMEELRRLGKQPPETQLSVLSLPDAFIPQGTRDEYLQAYGLDGEGIVERWKRLVEA